MYRSKGSPIKDKHTNQYLLSLCKLWILVKYQSGYILVNRHRLLSDSQKDKIITEAEERTQFCHQTSEAESRQLTLHSLLVNIKSFLLYV